MTTKYLVMWEEWPIIVVNTRTDAEEFILCEYEYNLYEYFCLFGKGKFFAQYKEMKRRANYGYYISEVPVDE